MAGGCRRQGWREHAKGEGGSNKDHKEEGKMEIREKRKINDMEGKRILKRKVNKKEKKKKKMYLNGK